MNSFITNNSEVFLFKIHMKKNGIFFNSLILTKSSENLKRNFGIISFRVRINMNSNFTGRMIFRRLNGFYERSHLLIC